MAFRTQKRPQSATPLRWILPTLKSSFCTLCIGLEPRIWYQHGKNSCRFPVSAKRKYHVESSRPRGIQGEANWPRHWGVYFWLFSTSWWFQPIWNMLVKLDHFPRQGFKKNVWNHHPVNHTTIGVVYQFESEPSMNATEVHLEKGCEKHGFHPHRVELRHSNYWSNS